MGELPNTVPLWPNSTTEPVGRQSTSLLSTSQTANRHPIHRWSNFIAGFSPEFVSDCIRQTRLRNRGSLIDPFAGMSTSLVEANFAAIPSIGFEPHPFFYDISRAKLSPPRHPQAIESLKRLLLGVRPEPGLADKVWGDTALTFLKKLIPVDELEKFAVARGLESGIAPEQRPLFRLVLSRALEAASASQTDGIYKAPSTRKRAVSYEQGVTTILAIVAEDIVGALPRYAARAVILSTSAGDMSMIPDGHCSICVTSPPYLNNFDFAEMTRMELYFWNYAQSWGDITKRIRSQLITNTTTAPTEIKRDHRRFRNKVPSPVALRLDRLVDELGAARSARNGVKDYERLVYPYFGQMSDIFRQLRRVMMAKADLHMVVADAALYGVHIQTEQILAQSMAHAGFEILDVDRMRDRGHRWVLAKRTGPGRPLGEFHIHARRA